MPNSATDIKEVLARVLTLEKEFAVVRQRFDDHLQEEETHWQENQHMLNQILEKLEMSLRWQMKLKIVIGTVATIFGAIMMILYHYAPWIWEALPKHGHTH